AVPPHGCPRGRARGESQMPEARAAWPRRGARSRVLRRPSGQLLFHRRDHGDQTTTEATEHTEKNGFSWNVSRSVISVISVVGNIVRPTWRRTNRNVTDYPFCASSDSGLG